MSFSVKIRDKFYSVPQSEAFLVMDTIRAVVPKDLETVYGILEKYLLKTAKEHTPSNGYMDFDAMRDSLNCLDITIGPDGKESDCWHAGMNRPLGFVEKEYKTGRKSGFSILDIR